MLSKFFQTHLLIMGQTSTKRINIYFVTIVITLGGLLFGYDTGVINGTQFYFSKYFELTGWLKGFIVSSALVRCTFRSCLSGTDFKVNWKEKIFDRFCSSYLLFRPGDPVLPAILPESMTLMVIFRILGGIAIGMASMNAPMYIAEIAPAKIEEHWLLTIKWLW